MQHGADAQPLLNCKAASVLLRIAVVSLARGEKPFEAPTTNVVETIKLLQNTYEDWVNNLLNVPQNRDGSDACVTRDGLVYKADALCVPEDPALRSELMRMHHDDPLAGHFAANKTLNLLRRKY